MLKSFKTEILPTQEQKIQINQTIGTCRFVYNFYVATNRQRHKDNLPFMSCMDFSKWLNNDFLPNNQDYAWIKSVSSKSVKQSLKNADTAFRKFFSHETGFPNFKKKRQNNVKMYFVRNNPNDCTCERHRIKISTLGFVRLKEKGYIPTSKNGFTIKSGTVSVKADRYFVSVLIDVPSDVPTTPVNPGIGIDLGIKEFAVVSDGTKFRNINKTAKMKRLKKQLKRQQRCLSRKLENLKKGEATQRGNIHKQMLKVQKFHARINNIRTDYINQTVNRIVKTKPSYITLEDLNVKGMMKNKHLSKAVASQKFYEFRTKLEYKCHAENIELRIADRFYPSSKLCNCCHKIKHDLKLSDRIYACECGYVNDRDFNASLNLRDASIYRTA